MDCMNLKSKVNRIRMSVMRRLTQDIGNSYDNTYNKSSECLSQINKILICRPNGRLGNQLLITPLIQEIENLFPNSEIHLFVKGNIAPVLFKNYPSVKHIISLPNKPFDQIVKYIITFFSLRKYQYDLVINVVNNSSSGRIATRFSRARIKFFNDTIYELQTRYDDYFHIAKYPIYNLRYLISKANIKCKIENKEIPLLDIKLSIDELAKGKKKLNSLINNHRRTICIYTYATGDKRYSKDWWNEVYTELTLKFGNEYNIIEILPFENVSQINFKAPSYYSKELRDIASIIANTEICLIADSGIMHLASAAQIPVIGLFSITNIEKYQPYGNRNIGLDTNKMNIPQIISIMEKKLEKNTTNSISNQFVSELICR